MNIELLAWHTLDYIPLTAKTEMPKVHSLLEAIDIFADERTRLYRRKLTQEFLFALWCRDIPFVIAGLTREEAQALPMFIEEAVSEAATALGVGDLLSLCGLRHNDWALVGRTARTVARQTMGFVPWKGVA